MISKIEPQKVLAYAVPLLLIMVGVLLVSGADKQLINLLLIAVTIVVLNLICCVLTEGGCHVL
jgi:hypothetical protein